MWEYARHINQNGKLLLNSFAVLSHGNFLSNFQPCIVEALKCVNKLSRNRRGAEVKKSYIEYLCWISLEYVLDLSLVLAKFNSVFTE